MKKSVPDENARKEETMIKAVELAQFAEKNGWIVVDKGDEPGDNYIRFLTPQGNIVGVRFYDDGSIDRIVA